MDISLETMDFVASNLTSPVDKPKWNSKAAWKLPGWAEPLVCDIELLHEFFMSRY